MPNTLAEVADYLSVEPRWINRLVKEKGMPRIAHGQYDLRVCVQWYIRYLRDQLEAAHAGGESLQAAELRKATIDADRAAIKLAAELGTVIRVEDARNEIEPVLSATKQKLLSLPKRAAPRLVNFSKAAQIEHLLASLIHELLDDIAGIPDRIERKAGLQENDQEGLAVDQVAAKAHRKRVGRPVSTAKRRGKRRAGKVPDRPGPVPALDDGRGVEPAD